MRIQKNILFSSTVISLLLFTSPQTFSQLDPFTISLTPTHETCPTNGAILIQPIDTTDGADLVYSLFRQPDLVNEILNTSEKEINALTSGTYRVIATQSFNGMTNIAQADVTINDEIEELAFTASVTNEICTGDGSISINLTSGTADSFAILSGPITRPFQVSNQFMNLTQGTYTVAVKDKCGQKSESVTILNEYFTFEIIQLDNSRIPILPYCDSITFSQVLTTGIPDSQYPLEVEWTIHPPNGGTDIVITQTGFKRHSPSFDGLQDTLPFFYGEEYFYDVKVTDACGIDYFSFDNRIDLEITNRELFQFSDLCNDRFLELNPYGLKFPFEVEFLDVPDTFDPSTFSSVHPGPFDDIAAYGNITTPIPIGNYKYKVTDDCGNEKIDSFEYKQGNVFLHSFLNYGCSDGLGSIFLYVNPEANHVIDLIIIDDAPIDYPNPVPDTIARGLTKANASYELPAGDYTFTAIDSSCNVLVTESFSIPTFELPTGTFEIVKQCGAFTLNLDYTSVLPDINDYGYYLQRYDSTLMEWGYTDIGNTSPIIYRHPALVNQGPNISFPFTGRFRIVYASTIARGLDPQPERACVNVLDEFTIEEETVETNIYGFDCGNGKVDVAIDATGSAPPFEYRIISKDGNSSFQVDNGPLEIFTDLSPGLYNFEIEDTCGNIFLRQFDVSSLALPEISADDIGCGRTVTLQAVDLPSISYQWWKNSNPNALLSDSSRLVIDNFTLSDTGAYTARLVYSSFSSCVDELLEYKILESQIPEATFSVGSVVATCLDNGKLVFTVLGDDPSSPPNYTVFNKETNTVVSGPTTQDTVHGLPPAEYIVEATITVCGTDTILRDSIEILNLYEPQVFNLISEPELCGNDGEIIVNVVSGNTDSFAILTGPLIISYQDSNKFTGLIAGDYLVGVKDSCGNVVTQSITIHSFDKELDITLSRNFSGAEKLISCDTTLIRVNINRKNSSGIIAYPIHLELLLTPSNSGPVFTSELDIVTGTSSSTIHDFKIPFYNGLDVDYEVRVTDQCGDIYIFSETYKDSLFVFGAAGHYIDCKSELRVLPRNFIDPVFVQFFDYPSGFDSLVANPDHPGPFYGNNRVATYSNIPAGQYGMTITDMCGRSYSRHYSVPGPALSYLAFGNHGSCEFDSGKGGIFIGNGGSFLGNATLLDGPLSSTNDFPLDISNFIINGNLSITDLDTGQYQVIVRDTCGLADTTLITVRETKEVLNNTVVTQECSSFSISLEHELENYRLSTTRYALVKLNESTGEWTHPNGSNHYNFMTMPNDNNSLQLTKGLNPNLAFSGTFRLLFATIDQDFSNPVPCIHILKEFTIGEPEISNIYGFNCGNGLLDVAVEANGPAPPFQYRIISRNGNSSFQVDNGFNEIFTGLIPGTYEFEIEDTCQNILVRQFDVTTLSFPSIRAEEFCNGSSAKLNIVNIPSLEYRWWKKGDESNILSVTNEFTIPDYLMTRDTGTYLAEVVYQSTFSCIEDTLTYHLMADGVDLVSCLGKTVYLDMNGLSNIQTTDIDNGSFDNCGIDTSYLSKYELSCSDVGLNNVMMYIIDNNYNIDSCNASIMVVDTINPLVQCQDINLVLDQNNLALLSKTMGSFEYSDACNIDTIILSQEMFTCDDLGVTQQCIEVEDENGNISNCEFSVTILSCTEPKFIIGPKSICPHSNAVYRLNENRPLSNFNWSYTGLGNLSPLADNELYIEFLEDFPSGYIKAIQYGKTLDSIQIFPASSDLCDLVTCNEICPFIDNEILNLNNAPDLFVSPHIIQSNATISNNRYVIFQAKNEVQLLKNFNVKSGSSFEIIIEECDQ